MIRRLFVLFFFLHFLNGCSIQAKDKLLRTFFDGVPAPGKASPIVKGEHKQENQGVKTEKVVPQAPIQFIHQPFLENQCDVCHDTKSSQKLVLKGKELCFSCHDDFTKDKKIAHYPVSEGACIDCHDPHQSGNKFILKEALPKICFNCHDEKEIRANVVHEGQNICNDCHNPHASNEEKLLK
ncbi:MAG: cytochrome c3 family protein [Candidatus Omnitrophota bacterium]|nr:cytochrome c3 family protein [Candidatus Omnitrophota bacterium]